MLGTGHKIVKEDRWPSVYLIYRILIFVTQPWLGVFGHNKFDPDVREGAAVNYDLLQYSHRFFNSIIDNRISKMAVSVSAENFWCIFSIETRMPYYYIRYKCNEKIFSMIFSAIYVKYYAEKFTLQRNHFMLLLLPLVLHRIYYHHMYICATLEMCMYCVCIFFFLHPCIEHWRWM